jgi:hypothetical protein
LNHVLLSEKADPTSIVASNSGRFEANPAYLQLPSRALPQFVRTLLAASLTLSVPFSPLRHASPWLIPPINHLTVAAGSSFAIQRLTATNFSFNV